jgi:outer membrane protein OmpA-like peptidoglycan-associated protein
MAITMKRFVYIMVALLAGVSAANAQSLTGVNIEGYTMERSGDYVVVDINLDISQLEVKGKQSAVITPHIVRDSTSLALKSIGVYGRNRYFFYERNEELAPTSDGDLEYRSNKLPESINYHAVVPYEEWMDGCKLVLERSDCGCGSVELGREGSVLVDRFPLEPYIPTLLYIRPEAEGVKSRSVSGSAFIDFPVNKVDIRPSYRNNVAELAKITGTIDSIKADKDITITAISIKGFASPEGSYANNTRLAKGRTEALKQYVMKKRSVLRIKRSMAIRLHWWKS